MVLMLVFAASGRPLIPLQDVGTFPEESMTVDTILNRLTNQFNKVEDYTARVDISVEMPYFRMPNKTVELYFKQPDKVKVESDGFAVVPKTGLAMSPARSFSNLFDLHVAGREKLHGDSCIIVEGMVNPDSLKFKMWGDEGEQGISVTSRLWVDEKRWVIVRIETFVDTTRMLSIVTDYEELNGGIQLPGLTEISFSIGGRFLGRLGDHDPMSGPFGDSGESYAPDVESDFQGTVRLQFSRYKVNQGLKDKIFEKTTF